ncbi:MAG: hypothetical protein IT379_23405 [Deltaproteobacteria bacterium]|nr:hypothetical protein [Deltaproteobacteria bacterium]
MATTTRFSGMCFGLVLVLGGCATAFEEEGAGRGHDALSGADADADCVEREARGEPCDDAVGSTDPADVASDDADRPAPPPDDSDPGVVPDPGAARECAREVTTGAACPTDGARSCSRADGTYCECVEEGAEDGTVALVWKCEEPPPPPPPPMLMCPAGVWPGATERIECREPGALCNIGDFWCECIEDDRRDPPFPVYYWACPTPPPPPSPVCPEGVFPGSDREVLCEPDRDATCSADGALCRCVEDARRAGPLPVFHWECPTVDPPAPTPAAD